MKIDRNLIQRTISGAILVAVIVASILVSPWTFVLLFLFVVVIGIREFHQLTAEQAAVAPTAAMFGGAILFLSLVFAALPEDMAVLGLAPRMLTVCLRVVYVACFVALAISELFLKRQNPIASVGYLAFGQIYIALPLGLLAQVMFVDGTWQPLWVLALFIIIWTNDTCAYVVGTLLGKHRMFERISPKKSWEGFFGGAVGALVAAYIFSLAESNIPLWQWVVLSQIVVVFGTFGDLFESLIKRSTGKKDSGNLIPGHGGVLDRFDSSLMAAPMLWGFTYILQLL